jgi:hypothetical protein
MIILLETSALNLNLIDFHRTIGPEREGRVSHHDWSGDA